MTNRFEGEKSTSDTPDSMAEMSPDSLRRGRCARFAPAGLAAQVAQSQRAGSFATHDEDDSIPLAD